MRIAKKPCPCRDNSVKENIQRYGNMFESYKEGEAAVRLKTGLGLSDPSMREFPILRISGHPHPRVDRRVYPLMNFSVAIDDHTMGITFVLRGKDHITNTEKQKLIYDCFGWTYPQFIHYGRLKIEGLSLSTSKIAKGIANKEYSGWDDVRLGTLRALAKRGIQPGAVRKAMLEVGIKKTDISFSWKNLYAYNKEIIDKKANRFFFVHEPKKLFVQKCPGKKVLASLHPDYPDRGMREMEIKGDRPFFISSRDFQEVKEGEFIRLMEALNVEIVKKEKDTILSKFVSEELKDARERKARLIHWVQDGLPVNVISPTGTFIGLGEKGLRKVKEGDIVQFERFGFVRIDKISERIIAYFAH
jgi:glutamyl-tRNA synthetase